MKKIIVVICNLFCAYSFIACSSKVQINDIPNDKKYFLPSETSNKEVKIDPQILEDFNLALKDFFNYKEKKENEQNIYKTGMRYFND
ncbi:hypothetical protein RMP56_001749 [Campylobacter jejuni]|uniref:hypothetical protein n=1 Tax=Campylobacter jejuni TaxID=197 RepID=UPI000F9D0CF0|nr:hypothetical protein [Campylobacter jejuni]EAH6629361.1 hypothetical protein [Campylobacter jejuni]EAI2463070.1 hypothetical protein [Campylobacter jejuni]EAJ3649581.1 hypothetical protein [Campylobacter jejuni]EAJ8970498.1 hypothetical protein [Campylobacter jejuni]ECL7251374.1 hypothetical protein [Campylobacter jejuni]